VGEKQTDFGELSRAVPGKSRKLKVSHILILLLLIGAGAFTLYRLNLKKQLQVRIEAIRAAGYPVTCEELDQWYSIPDNVENAAYIILDAFEYYQEPQDKELMPLLGKAELPMRNIPLTEETKNIIAQFLNDNKKVLELLHEAATLEYSRYPIDLNFGFRTHLDHFHDLRISNFLLYLQAVLHGENEEPQLAIRSVISALAIANSLSKEPIIISQRAHASQYTDTISILERLINRVDFTDEQLIELSLAFANAYDDSGMKRAFVGERCMILSICRELSSINPDYWDSWDSDMPSVPILQLYQALGLADSYAIIYFELIDEYIKTFQLPPDQRQKVADAIDTRFNNISKIHILLHKFRPSLSQIVILDLRNIAGLRTAQAAIAIQRYRLATGKLPETLENLVPDYLETVPQDPFDGKELRYKKLETGYVVYSIGEDLSDDGGIEMPRTTKERRKIRNWDITFVVVLGTPHGER